MTSVEVRNKQPMGLGIVVSEENRPSPTEFALQLLKEVESNIRVGDFITTRGDPRILALVANVVPQHTYYKIPLLVGASLREGFELKDEAPPSASWTVVLASVLGELGEGGFHFTGRSPHPGQGAEIASPLEVAKALGFRMNGVMIGTLSSRPDITVSLDPEIFMTEHIVTFGVTRFGKSYTNAVTIEEFAKANRAIIIIDPHGEYWSLSTPNNEPIEAHRLPPELEPRGFNTVTYSPPAFRDPALGEKLLTVSFSELEASEIIELTGIEGENQIAVVYESVRILHEKEPWQQYDVNGFINQMRAVKDDLKMNVALESIAARLHVLQRGIGVFGQNFNPKEMISPGQITVVNLSGLDLRAQRVLVTTLLRRLFYERQWGNIPPFSVAIDEAQRFAPDGADPVSKRVIEELVKEGLKFGVNVLAMAQRPTELSHTVRAQAETKIFHRISETTDVNYVAGLIDKSAPGASESLPRLSKGEAILTGACTNYVAVRMRTRSRQSKHAGRTGALRLRRKVGNGNGTKLNLAQKQIETSRTASGEP